MSVSSAAGVALYAANAAVVTSDRMRFEAVRANIAADATKAPSRLGVSDLAGSSGITITALWSSIVAGGAGALGVSSSGK